MSEIGELTVTSVGKKGADQLIQTLKIANYLTNDKKAIFPLDGRVRRHVFVYNTF